MAHRGAATKPLEISPPVEVPATPVVTKPRYARLTSVHREEIISLYFENRSVPEISNTTGIIAPTVRRVIRDAGFSSRNKIINASSSLTEIQTRLINLGRDYVLGRTKSPEHVAEVAALREIFTAAVNAAQERATVEAIAQFGA